MEGRYTKAAKEAAYREKLRGTRIRCSYCSNNAWTRVEWDGVGVEIPVCSLCLRESLRSAAEEKAEVTVNNITEEEHLSYARKQIGKEEA
jgi:hypothetical protein